MNKSFRIILSLIIICFFIFQSGNSNAKSILSSSVQKTVRPIITEWATLDPSIPAFLDKALPQKVVKPIFLAGMLGGNLGTVAITDVASVNLTLSGITGEAKRMNIGNDIVIEEGAVAFQDLLTTMREVVSKTAELANMDRTDHEGWLFPASFLTYFDPMMRSIVWITEKSNAPPVEKIRMFAAMSLLVQKSLDPNSYGDAGLDVVSQVAAEEGDLTLAEVGFLESFEPEAIFEASEVSEHIVYSQGMIQEAIAENLKILGTDIYFKDFMNGILELYMGTLYALYNSLDDEGIKLCEDALVMAVRAAAKIFEFPLSSTQTAMGISKNPLVWIRMNAPKNRFAAIAGKRGKKF